MNWLKTITIPTGRILDKNGAVITDPKLYKEGTPEVQHHTICATRTRDRRKDESRSMRVRRNARELAQEVGISDEDAARRLRSGDPLGRSS